MPYTLGPRPDLPADLESVLASFRKASTGTLGHLTDFGFALGLAPLCRPAKAVGLAFTVRVLAVVSCLLPGPQFLVYLALWLVLPQEP